MAAKGLRNRILAKLCVSTMTSYRRAGKPLDFLVERQMRAVKQ
jgi:hypothetical protein